MLALAASESEYLEYTYERLLALTSPLIPK